MIITGEDSGCCGSGETGFETVTVSFDREEQSRVRAVLSLKTLMTEGEKGNRLQPNYSRARRGGLCVYDIDA